MARTIEGGITLVDLTDGQSYYTFVRYSKNADGSGYVDTPSSETIYIGVYAGPLSSPPVYSDSGWTWSKYVGDDGGQGPQGVSVTSGRELYYLTTTGTAPSQITAANQIVSTDTPNRWSSVVATYQTGADYYTCIETTLSNGQKVWSAPSKNIALTTASADAQEAKTIATGINQYFWWIPNDHSTSVKAGVYMTQIPSATFKDAPAGGNIIMRSDGMYIRHGATLDAQVTSSGLTVKKGGIEAGTFNSDNYVYAWSEDRSDRSLAINGSGSKTDWRFLAGKKFGVDKAGNLYAAGADIRGKVTVEAGSNVYTIDDVNPLEIGGRNLFISYDSLATAKRKINNATSYAYNATTGVYVIKQTAASTEFIQIWTEDGVSDYSSILGKTVTLSARSIVTSRSAADARVYCYCKKSDGSAYSFGLTKNELIRTFVMPTDVVSIGYLIKLDQNRAGSANETATFTGIKLEIGNKATDWTPAPEDVQAEIDAKKSVHTIDSTYKPNYSTALNWAKTSQTYSNNGIDTTGVKVGDTVRLGVLVNDFTGNPTVYVVGTVTAIGSKSSFTMEGKGLDTTIIDGGNILTNSIGANQIKANVIDTSKLTIGAQDEMLNSKIEVGGRNLVWDTEWKNISTRWSNWGSPTTREIVTANGKRWLHLVTTASAFQGYSQAEDKRNGYGEIKAGDKVVISYSAYAKTAGQICTVGCHWLNSSGRIVTQNWFSSTLTTTEKRYTSPVFTIPNNAVGFNVMIGDNTANAQELWISQVKIEFGTKATDWTPAPEDLAATATSYITNIGNDGIRVHPASTENNSVLINSDGMTVYKGGTADTDSVAFYGDTARIGKGTSRHVEVKTGGMQVYNGEGDSNMVAHIGYESVQGETGATMGAFFTFGARKRNQTKGEWSVAEGSGTTASGYSSHAEGNGTTASGSCSHAEGNGTTASYWASHAEGNDTTASYWASHAEGYGTTASDSCSHAEGNETTASSFCSHAEGNETIASGWCSHAGGNKTTAERRAQTAIGECNATDASGEANKRGKYVLIIGNGSDDAHSNALTVSWTGNVELAIDSSATGSSTVDGKIMDSLRSLGWNASTEGVIV